MWFELGILFLGSIYVIMYSADLLYWIYENEIEKLEKKEDEKKEAEIPESVKQMYN